MNLYEHLQVYAKGGSIPMHMPGHKRNPEFTMSNPYSWDVTELEGTDNLYCPQGIIKEERERIREMYGTKDSYLLVNGSTGGILTAIASCCKRGDRILLARNCHKSVYHAIFLLELSPHYVFPQVDKETGILLDVLPEEVEKILKKEKVSCLVITSPTYEGVVSDVAKIAQICHRWDVPLIVDQAHGAHFAWSEMFPPTAMEQGADLVIESLHKTLPCLTQTALLHRASDRVSRSQVERYLSIFQTSSPSYVLMGSISQCMSWLQQEDFRIWENYKEGLAEFGRQAEKWKHLRLWCQEKQEVSKLVVGSWGTNLSGVELGRRLREEYRIEVEMASQFYVLAMTSVADEPADLQRLAWALTQIDDRLKNGDNPSIVLTEIAPEVKMTPYKAVYSSWKSVPLKDSVGEISAEYAFFYPPGIPFLVPGEKISESVCERIRTGKRVGVSLLGLQDEQGENIRICQRKE